MRTTTELIDIMHDLEAGTRLVVETEDDRYQGTVTRSEYEPPDADGSGTLRVEFDQEDSSEETVELRRSASASEKFTRPALYTPASSDRDDESLGAIVDISVDSV